MTDNNADFIVTEREKGLIERVLLSFNYKCKNIYKLRDAYKIEIEDRNICLKKVKHGISNIINCSYLTENLRMNGFNNTAAYHKTKNNKTYVCCGKYVFYIMDWIDGQQCDLNNKDECKKVVESLAKLHLCLEKVNIKPLKIKTDFKNWPQIFYECMNDLERFRRLINKKIIRNEFDNIYSNYIDEYYSRSAKALDMLNKSNYFSILKVCREEKLLCYDVTNYKNIIIKDSFPWFCDLESVSIGMQIVDFAVFLRKLMYKKSFRWDFKQAKLLIETYSKVKPLSKDELQIIFALVIYPEKFWKLGRKRYIKHKNWDEIKYMKKLNKLVEESKFERNFIEDLDAYFNSNTYDEN